MNYNDVVNRFRQIVQDHKMLQDFGYGQISDIKTRSEGEGEADGCDYPYLFLNPGVHQRTESQITYNFNMIIMDMAREEEADPYQNFLNIQSDCIQYCDDVLARLRYHYTDKPEILFNVSYTPFYERFQDDLAGSTAVLSIVVPNNINDCISPYRPELQMVLDVESTTDKLFRPDISGSPQNYQITNVDTYSGMRPGDPANFYNIVVPTTGSWEFTEQGTAVKLSGAIPFNKPRVLIVRYSNGDQVYIDPTTSTFPDNVDLNVDFNYVCKWEIDFDPALVDYVAIGDNDEPVSEPEYRTYAGVQLTATYRPIA